MPESIRHTLLASSPVPAPAPMQPLRRALTQTSLILLSPNMHSHSWSNQPFLLLVLLPVLLLVVVVVVLLLLLVVEVVLLVVDVNAVV